ncbi:hypothetical protein BDA99DRAFT_428956 [Phascolomyces articulosus]|uniref:EamA domain-containing protein n=1 Tax=Phascolomyces articulosus TaxID=60185 RepID=A0AAD5PLZ0_9FUNG|nr:hypothetical protein BDA99DRAFT_428956 [Phascolomyces articulosus]
MSHEQRIDVSENGNETTPLLLPQQQEDHGYPANNTAIASSFTRKREVVGLLLVTASGLAMSSASVFVKIGGFSFPSSEIVFIRAIIQASLALGGCFLLSLQPFGRHGVRKWVVLRGFLGAIALACHYYSITKLPLSDAAVIISLHPMFAAVLAAVLLGEPFGWFERGCVLFCIAGAVLVTKPSFIFNVLSNNNSNLLLTTLLTVPHHMDGTTIAANNDAGIRVTALFSSLTAAILSAVAYISVRKAGSQAHYLNHTFSLGLFAAILTGIKLNGFLAPTSAKQFGSLGLTGVFAFIGQCLVNQGLQMAPTGPGTLMCLNEVVFAYIFGLVIFREYPDWSSIMGAIVIISTTGALGWKKARAKEQDIQQQQQPRREIRRVDNNNDGI